jgi:hypothetical protein
VSLFHRWVDLKREAGSLLDALEIFAREEEIETTRDEAAGCLRAAVDVDGVRMSLVLSVQETIVLATHVLADGDVPFERRADVALYLASANVSQQFATMSISATGKVFARTALETAGIPLTREAIQRLVYAGELLAFQFLPFALRVGRGDLDADSAGQAARDAWREFCQRAARDKR